MSWRPAWSTEYIPGQSGLCGYVEINCLKKRKKERKKGRKKERKEKEKEKEEGRKKIEFLLCTTIPVFFILLSYFLIFFFLTFSSPPQQLHPSIFPVVAITFMNKPAKSIPTAYP